jgi:hypothetical protein
MTEDKRSSCEMKTDVERIAVLESQVQYLLEETKSLRSCLIEVATITDNNFRRVNRQARTSSSWLDGLGF